MFGQDWSIIHKRQRKSRGVDVLTLSREEDPESKPVMRLCLAVIAGSLEKSCSKHLHF